MIGILSVNIQEAIGGVEVFNQNMVKMLSNAGFSVYSPLCSLTYKPVNLLCKVLKLLFAGRNFRYDMIIIQQSGFLELLYLPILALSKRKLLLISHVNKDFKHCKNKLLRSVSKILINLTSTKVICLTVDQSISIFNGKATPVGTLIDNYYWDSDVVLSPNKTPYILFFGRICREKGIELLLNSYRKAQLSTNNLPPLRLYGSIPNSYIHVLSELIQKLDLTNQVSIYTPVYDTSKLIKIIDESLFAVLPSYNEAFPLSFMEVISRRKICLCSKLPWTNYFTGIEDYTFEVGSVEELADLICRHLSPSADDIAFLRDQVKNISDGHKLLKLIQDYVDERNYFCKY